MSYVEVVILRHLMHGPAHGYQLRKHVEATAGVTLNNNALYPALRRFEEAGAVVKTAEQSEGRPPRHVYTLTPVGREMLHEMLCELPPDQAGDEAEFLVRLAQFAMLAPHERVHVLDARDAAVGARLDALHGLAERTRGETWGWLATDRLIRLGEDERTWLAELRSRAATAPVRPDGE